MEAYATAHFWKIMRKFQEKKVKKKSNKKIKSLETNEKLLGMMFRPARIRKVYGIAE